eukprot:s2017_g5.t1
MLNPPQIDAAPQEFLSSRMGLEELGFSESTSTLIVWLVRALLPFLLFIIWYATQPPEHGMGETHWGFLSALYYASVISFNLELPLIMVEPKQTYHRGQLLAARQVAGGAPPELGTLQVKRLEDREGWEEPKPARRSKDERKNSERTPPSETQKAPASPAVQEHPKSEEKEGSDVMEDLQGVLSFIAFKDERI